MVWAVLPLKNFDHAKVRLSPVLSPAERACLFQAMVEDVLAELAEHPAIEQTVVVSEDPRAEMLAAQYGVAYWSETSLNARGLIAVVQAAAEKLQSLKVDTMLVVHGDLPLLCGGELFGLIAQHQSASAPVVTIAPDFSATGTNCMLCSPPCAIPFHYGEESFSKHCQQASVSDVGVNIGLYDSIGLDVDSPEDLLNFLQQAPQEKLSMRYLQTSGIAERLSSGLTNHQIPADSYREVVYE
jgi:2-phospho-L-lactate guanylyltransferase